jgi:hypothetical protein
MKVKGDQRVRFALVFFPLLLTFAMAWNAHRMGTTSN